MIASRSSLATLLLAIPIAAAGAAWAGPQPEPAAREADIRQLERSWAQLDQELRLLDQLLPPPDDGAGSPGLPSEIGPALLRANRPPSAAIDPRDPALAPPPLALPSATSLAQGRVQSLSLRQALAVANQHSPELQEQRLEVARSLADLQARLGRSIRTWSRFTPAVVRPCSVLTTSLESGATTSRRVNHSSRFSLLA